MPTGSLSNRRIDQNNASENAPNRGYETRHLGYESQAQNRHSPYESALTERQPRRLEYSSNNASESAPNRG